VLPETDAARLTGAWPVGVTTAVAVAALVMIGFGLIGLPTVVASTMMLSMREVPVAATPPLLIEFVERGVSRRYALTESFRSATALRSIRMVLAALLAPDDHVAAAVLLVFGTS
jgi:hypothetical protein